MTEPTRDALHAETIHLLEGHHRHWKNYRDAYSRQMVEQFAYAAECVRKRAELEAEVESLRKLAAHYAAVADEHKAEVERLRADLDDSLAQQGDIVGRLTAELDAINAAAADFYAEDASNLRAHPDVAWGIDGSLDERVAEWRNDLAERIERLLAAYAAATREGADG